MPYSKSEISEFFGDMSQEYNDWVKPSKTAPALVEVTYLLPWDWLAYFQDTPLPVDEKGKEIPIYSPKEIAAMESFEQNFRLQNFLGAERFEHQATNDANETPGMVGLFRFEFEPETVETDRVPLVPLDKIDMGEKAPIAFVNGRPAEEYDALAPESEGVTMHDWL